MIDYDKSILGKNGQPLKIGMLASHHCIRVVKRARALKKLGYKLYGNGNKVSYGVDNTYDSYFYWSNEQQFKESISIMIDQGVTILDYSNEPDYPVIWAREVIISMNKQDDVKLVADLHDLDSIRRGIIPIPEREMFNAADGFIYVSLPIKEITNKLHDIKKPNIVLYPYCNEGIVEYDEALIATRHGMVYEGGANSPEDNELNQAFAYRSLYHIIKKLVDMGNEVHMFCGNFDAFQNYQNIGAMLYPPTDYDEMMKRMTQFKYGILVFNNKGNTEPQVKYTTANKLFEYIACGLPPIACWCQECSNIVKKWDVGFVFDDIEEIQDTKQLETKYLEKMENIKNYNKKVTMEAFIVKLENLYAKLLGVEGKGMSEDIQKLHEFEYGKEDTARTLAYGSVK